MVGGFLFHVGGCEFLRQRGNRSVGSGAEIDARLVEAPREVIVLAGLHARVRRRGGRRGGRRVVHTAWAVIDAL